MTRKGPALSLLLCLAVATLPANAAPEAATGAAEEATALPEAVVGLPLEITASSTLVKAGRRYGPEGLSDPEAALPWCEGQEGPGPGAWLEARLGGPPGPAEARDLIVKLVPGYAKAERLFSAHARPGRAILTLKDRISGAAVTPQDSYQLAFHDRPRVLLFRIPVERAVDPSRLDLRLAFDAVFPGNAFEVLCLSELRIFLEGPEPAPEALARDVAGERAYLGAMLRRSETGERAALRGLIRLASSAYAATPEGGQRLDEIYLDLLVARPWLFLSILAREDDGVRDTVLAALRDPARDTHPPDRVLGALRLAQGRGLGGEPLADLIRHYTLRNLREKRRLESARADEGQPAPATDWPQP